MVKLEGKPIAIFNLDGKFYATDDTCPHEGGSLACGFIEGENVTCPWHGATFHIGSGRTLEPPAGEKMGPPVDRGIACYPVSIVGDDVQVEIQTVGKGMEKTRRWNFDKEREGVTPSEFEVVLGDWVVRKDAAAPSAPHVLAQVATFPEGIHFPRCLLKDFCLEDLRISVKFKPISGEYDQAGGLVFRFQDPQNYYVLRANALDDFALFKCVNDQRWPLKRHYVRSDEWQTIMVECRGPFISGYWNDRLLIEVRDESFSAGRVGLWTISDSVSYFDDLQITTLE